MTTVDLITAVVFLGTLVCVVSVVIATSDAVGPPTEAGGADPPPVVRRHAGRRGNRRA